MRFKIKKGTELFKTLDALGNKVVAVEKEAGKLTKKLGFKQYMRKRFVLAGGIIAFHSTEKPANYAYAFGSSDREAIFPKKIKANKEILELIESLPVVNYSELNRPLKYDGFKTTQFTATGGKHISMRPGVVWKKNVILIDVPEYIKYKPVKDMIEITFSEFEKLRKGK